jgi:hypothetical protein
LGSRTPDRSSHRLSRGKQRRAQRDALSASNMRTQTHSPFHLIRARLLAHRGARGTSMLRPGELAIFAEVRPSGAPNLLGVPRAAHDPWPIETGLRDFVHAVDWIALQPLQRAAWRMLRLSALMTITGRRRDLAAIMYEHNPRLARRLCRSRVGSHKSRATSRKS